MSPIYSISVSLRDDLYDGFMEKMANLEIENEKVIPYCKHCGAELPKGQTICIICGNKIT